MIIVKNIKYFITEFDFLNNLDPVQILSNICNDPDRLKRLSNVMHQPASAIKQCDPNDLITMLGRLCEERIIGLQDFTDAPTTAIFTSPYETDSGGDPHLKKCFSTLCIEIAKQLSRLYGPAYYISFEIDVSHSKRFQKYAKDFDALNEFIDEKSIMVDRRSGELYLGPDYFPSDYDYRNADDMSGYN